MLITLLNLLAPILAAGGLNDPALAWRAAADTMAAFPVGGDLQTLSAAQALGYAVAGLDTLRIAAAFGQSVETQTGLRIAAVRLATVSARAERQATSSRHVAGGAPDCPSAPGGETVPDVTAAAREAAVLTALQAATDAVQAAAERQPRAAPGAAVAGVGAPHGAEDPPMIVPRPTGQTDTAMRTKPDTTSPAHVTARTTRDATDRTDATVRTMPDPAGRTYAMVTPKHASAGRTDVAVTTKFEITGPADVAVTAGPDATGRTAIATRSTPDTTGRADLAATAAHPAAGRSGAAPATVHDAVGVEPARGSVGSPLAAVAPPTATTGIVAATTGAVRTPEAAPAMTALEANRARKLLWAGAMTQVAREHAAALPTLSAQQRRLEHIRIAALSSVAQTLTGVFEAPTYRLDREGMTPGGTESRRREVG